VTRTEILTRYRRLRQVSKEHHHAVLSIFAPDVLLDWAKRLGLTAGKKVVFVNGGEKFLRIVGQEFPTLFWFSHGQTLSAV